MNTLLLTLANMGVNLDDVADVVNNCIPQLIFFGVVVAAAIIVLIAMAVNKKLAKPTKFMVRPVWPGRAGGFRHHAQPGCLWPYEHHARPGHRQRHYHRGIQ